MENILKSEKSIDYISYFIIFELKRSNLRFAAGAHPYRYDLFSDHILTIEVAL